MIKQGDFVKYKGKNNEFFTKGNEYKVLSYTPNCGITVVSDTGRIHSLTENYWPEHFDAVKKTGRVIELGYPGQDKVAVESVSITYWQDDTESDEPQAITLTTKDLGGGHFLGISTGRWEINDVDELTELLNDFKRRAGL